MSSISKRPESSRPHSSVSQRSRSAWDNEQGGYDNKGMDSPTSRQSSDYGAEGMSDENFDNTVRVEQAVEQADEPPSGCWYKFKKGVRCEFQHCLIK